MTTAPKMTEKINGGGKNNKRDCRCRRKGQLRCGKMCKRAHKDFRTNKSKKKKSVIKNKSKRRGGKLRYVGSRKDKTITKYFSGGKTRKRIKQILYKNN